MTECIAPVATWRAGSRNSSLIYSPTEPVPAVARWRRTLQRLCRHGSAQAAEDRRRRAAQHPAGAAIGVRFQSPSGAVRRRRGQTVIRISAPANPLSTRATLAWERAHAASVAHSHREGNSPRNHGQRPSNDGKHSGFRQAPTRHQKTWTQGRINILVQYSG